MRRFAIPLLLLALGAVAATGFAPLQWWPLTLVGLAGLIWLVHEAPTLKQALLRGWWFGVGHFAVNGNWIQHAFVYQDKMPHWLGYGAVLLLSLYLAVYPAIAAGLAWWLARPRPDRNRPASPDAALVLAFGGAWIVGEWLRAVMFTGYAWDPIGVVWVAVLPVARTAGWIGTYALSGMTAVLAGALMLLIWRRWRLAAIMLAATAAGAAANLDRPAAVTPAPGAPHVRVVQPNIGLDERSWADSAEESFEKLLNLSGGPGPAPRLVVWPEGALEYLLETDYPVQYYYESPLVTRARIAMRLGPHDILLTGGDGLIFDHQGKLALGTNSIFALDDKGAIVGRYDKAHLVPYGEYLPLPWLLRPLGLARLVPGDVDFRPGPGPRDMVIPGFGSVGGQICYEIVFSGQVVDEAHRPKIIFNPSNDAWFGSWGPPQHLAQARMRALEEGLPILRSTPTGISAVIAADGRLLGAVPLGHAGEIETPFPPALPPTLFSRLGNWAAAIVALLLLGAGVAIRRLAR